MKENQVLTRKEKDIITERITKQNLEDDPATTFNLWKEAQEERTDVENNIALESFFIGEFFGKLEKENEIGADIVAALKEVKTPETLEAIKTFIGIATRAQAARDNQTYSKETEIMKLYSEAIQADERNIYQAWRFIKNISR